MTRNVPAVATALINSSDMAEHLDAHAQALCRAADRILSGSGRSFQM
jgi:hypothetical protein